MKSQIILVQNKKRKDGGARVGTGKCGFLIAEIMMSFSLMTLFFVSTLILFSSMKNLEMTTKNQLILIKKASADMDYFIKNNIFRTMQDVKISSYGNYSKKIEIGKLDILHSNFASAWGSDSCDARFSFNPLKIKLENNGVNLGNGNVSTDLEVRNGIAYVTADSSSATSHDLFIIDIRDPTSPNIITSQNTGPGLAAIEVAGPYIFAANLGTTHQLQIFDIHSRDSPLLISKLKLPTPDVSTTPVFASSIFYSNKKIFLGTQKWDGNEFSIIDVEDPFFPKYLGGFNTNTLVSDILVKGDTAYLANSNDHQMSILDISNPNQIQETGAFSPPGYQTQEGKYISFFEGRLSFSRTTGGFNVAAHHEIFIFGTTSQVQEEYSHDIPGGVYGTIMRQPFIFLATRSPGHEFQVWNEKVSEKIFDMPLGFFPQKMVCDRDSLYFATGDQYGIAVITL